MELLVIALVIVAILVAAVSFGAGRQGQFGAGKTPPALPPPGRAAPPAPKPRFIKRPAGKHFRKRIQAPPPRTKELGQKPKGNGKAVTQKKVHLDFSLPCRVTGRAMFECGCQVCIGLRKKFGV
ncbi:MAG TPA: hypothetical protein VF621_14595 [Pyrinomonadaceae bacterium]|jgi:hypothetical protein